MEALSEEGLEAIEGHVHEEAPSPSDRWRVEISQLLSDQTLLGTLEEEGVRRRPILPQFCVRGGEWPTPRKLGRQVEKKPESGPLLRSTRAAEQVGKPKPVTIGPKHHRERPRHGSICVSQAKALDHDLFEVRDPLVCDPGAS